jgi:hypothetical protein
MTRDEAIDRFKKSEDKDYNQAMTDLETTALLQRYSHAEISAAELRRKLGDISYADVIIELAARNIPLPRASQKGREDRLAKAHAWLFPRSA